MGKCKGNAFVQRKLAKAWVTRNVSGSFDSRYALAQDDTLKTSTVKGTSKGKGDCVRVAEAGEGMGDAKCIGVLRLALLAQDDTLKTNRSRFRRATE